MTSSYYKGSKQLHKAYCRGYDAGRKNRQEIKFQVRRIAREKYDYRFADLPVVAMLIAAFIGLLILVLWK